jgi:hypothetical protein
MPGLVPGIHVLGRTLSGQTWMAGLDPQASGTDYA